ncbi:MAG: hydrogenase maturation protease [Chloroflexi bacterium]|jgi:hydrogenase maturation protease|nr:hydrogenase maturation protease [Chloroflexota bacterium]
MSDPRGPLVIVGVGNVLGGDDGVGVHVVRELRRLAERGEVGLPPRTELVDGGLLGLGLSPVVNAARALVIVDAALIAGPPGTVAVVDGAAVRSHAARESACASDGVGELVDAARLTGTLPPAFSLVCIRPASLRPGHDLSDPVRAALDAAVVTTLHEARRLHARTCAPSAAPDGRDLVGVPA